MAFSNPDSDSLCAVHNTDRFFFSFTLINPKLSDPYPTNNAHDGVFIHQGDEMS